FHQSDDGTDLYIVREGTVAIRVRASEGVEVDLAQLGEGDFFGEMSLFEDAPRSATCTMTEGGRLFRLRKADFFSLTAEHPEAAIKVMSRMASITAGRLQNTGAFLSDLVQWGENARRRAITDDLTGLHNRRYLDDALDEQLAQAKVSDDRFSLIMMDLDKFHAINDAYGQQFGDEVIAAVAVPVADSIGETDIAARYGGDEFVIILPARTAEESREIAERVRTSVEDLQITSPTGVPVSVTTSQGIAEYPRHAKDVEALKELADKALYAAKEGGRNRAAIASEE
ncbi:MAG: GGDEF domain-containing protein, partial [Spirochaetaceae bacterium]|nr:GGDEF domain-containing protein [Spirochaetaceae bacterium]